MTAVGTVGEGPYIENMRPNQRLLNRCPATIRKVNGHAPEKAVTPGAKVPHDAKRQFLVEACTASDTANGARDRDVRQEMVSGGDKTILGNHHRKLLVAKVKRLVLRHLPERLSEESLAGTFGIEVRELRYAFRQVCGTAPYTALRAFRVDEVKRRLDADVNLSVETAMRQCGFGSYAYFRKEFQRKFEIDPRDFRKTSHLTQKIPAGRSMSNRQGTDRCDAAKIPETGLSLQG